MRRNVLPLLSGDAGTRQTLGVMCDLVRAGVAHPLVRQYAVEIARQVPPGDLTALTLAIRRWLQDHMHFVHDPLTVEHVTAPELLLADVRARYFATGDCDDVAVLGAALAGAVGVEGRFVVVAFHDASAEMAHVYTELFDGARWRELDITRSSAQAEAVQAVSRTWYVPIWDG